MGICCFERKLVVSLNKIGIFALWKFQKIKIEEKKMRSNLLTLLLFMITINSSCEAKTSTKESKQSTFKEPETQILIKTTQGDITIKLYNDTEFHRNNFIKLVNENYFDSLLFHRVIKGFMIQAGDPDSKNAPQGKALGAGGPDYTIPSEFIYPKYFHKKGALSAARQADQANPERRSSGSQFYIVTGKKYNDNELKSMEQQLRQQEAQNIFNNLCMENRELIISMQENKDQQGLNMLQEKFASQTDSIIKSKETVRFTKEQVEAYTTIGGAPFLDNQYTVFGEVLEGLDIVDMIQNVSTDSQDRPNKDVRILSTTIIK